MTPTTPNPKPAPAPEPKQGSEEPITDHALECWHGIYTMSHNEAKWFNEACYARIITLRADLAAAREEIAVRDASISDYARQMADIREHWHAEATENVTLKADLAAEKARADRAEERVCVLEDVVVNANRVGWNEALSMEASSINAARARKEGEAK